MTHESISAHTAEVIADALATPGGHLSIGHGGFTLYFGAGATLTGYDVEPIKAACLAAGRAAPALMELRRNRGHAGEVQPP